MKTIFTVLFSIFFLNAYTQVGIGTTTPNAKAALDITDSTKGLLIPRMTMVKRNAIAAPPTGLMVYQTDSTKGFWYFDGVSWQNIHGASNPSYYGGKHTIVLSDTITNSQAQAKIAAEFGPNTQEIRISGCLSLSSIDLSMFTTATDIHIMDNPGLGNINLSNLKTVDGFFLINNCPLLSNLNVSSLEKITYRGDNGFVALLVDNTGFTSINFPKLKRVLGPILFVYNPHLQSIAFPALSQELSMLQIISNPALTTVSFPVLTSVGFFDIESNNALTTLQFPSLTSFTANGVNVSYLTGTVLKNCPNLTSFTLGTLISFRNPGFENTNTKLSSAAVNDLLHNFASIVPHITGRYLSFKQIPAAPPTGQGIIDKNALISYTNTVLTD